MSTILGVYSTKIAVLEKKLNLKGMNMINSGVYGMTDLNYKCLNWGMYMETVISGNVFVKWKIIQHSQGRLNAFALVKIM